MIVSRLAGALDQNRFRSVALLPRPGWLKDQLERQGIDTYVLKMNGMFDLEWVRKACQLVRRERVPDSRS